MKEPSQETYEELEGVLLDLLNQLVKLDGADDGSDALEAALGQFAKDHLDCSLNKDGSVILQVAAMRTIN